jgi:hypothetical protein
MTHPKLDQAVQKVDEFLAAYPTLCQYGECVIESHWATELQAGIKRILIANYHTFFGLIELIYLTYSSNK